MARAPLAGIMSTAAVLLLYAFSAFGIRRRRARGRRAVRLARPLGEVVKAGSSSKRMQTALKYVARRTGYLRPHHDKATLR